MLVARLVVHFIYKKNEASLMTTGHRTLQNIEEDLTTA